MCAIESLRDKYNWTFVIYIFFFALLLQQQLDAALHRGIISAFDVFQFRKFLLEFCNPDVVINPDREYRRAPTTGIGEKTTTRPRVARGVLVPALECDTADAITRRGTWRAPECTQCLPYWLACSVLRNVINTSLTHAPIPRRNVQPLGAFSQQPSRLRARANLHAHAFLSSWEAAHRHIIRQIGRKGRGRRFYVRVCVYGQVKLTMNAHTYATWRINYRRMNAYDDARDMMRA